MMTQTLSSILFILGVFLLIGAISGATSPLKPFEKLHF